MHFFAMAWQCAGKAIGLIKAGGPILSLCHPLTFGYIEERAAIRQFQGKLLNWLLYQENYRERPVSYRICVPLSRALVCHRVAG
jgi:hypothetical protein